MRRQRDVEMVRRLCRKVRREGCGSDSQPTAKWSRLSKSALWQRVARSQHRLATRKGGWRYDCRCRVIHEEIILMYIYRIDVCWATIDDITRHAIEAVYPGEVSLPDVIPGIVWFMGAKRDPSWCIAAFANSQRKSESSDTYAYKRDKGR
jgi:hypothetical protein